MSDWHIRKIPKGTYGELSKITEELEEALDSEERGQILMLMFELSDIIGAAGGVGAKYGMKLDDLVTFSKLRSEIAIKDLENKGLETEPLRLPAWEDFQAQLDESIQAMLGNRDWCQKQFKRGEGHSCIVKWNKITDQPFDGKLVSDFMMPSEMKYHLRHTPKDREAAWAKEFAQEGVKTVTTPCFEQLREEDWDKAAVVETKAALEKIPWFTKWWTGFISWMKNFPYSKKES